MIWPGRPFPLARRGTGKGTNFSFFSENAEGGVELCLFDADDREQRIELTQRTAFNWHGYLPASARASATACASTGRARPSTGTSSTRPSSCLIRHAKAIDGGVRWEAGEHARRTVRVGPSSRGRRRRLDDAAAMPRCVVVDPAFDWEGDRPTRDSLERDCHLRAAREGLHARHPDVREDLRGTYAGLASDRGDQRTSTSLGVTAVELLRCTTSSRSASSTSAGSRTTGLLVDAADLAPHVAYAATGTQGEQLEEFKGMVKAVLHRPRHRGHPRRRLQPHGRRRPPGPTPPRASTRPRQPPLLPARPQRLVHGLHGHAATASTAVHPIVPRPAHGLAALLGGIDCHVDGFRFDLASVLGRDSTRRRCWSARVDVISEDPVLSHQADRRALGRGRAATRSADFPGRPLVRLERPLPRRRPPVLAGRAGADRPWRRGSAAATTSIDAGRRASALDQLHHLPRRLHARRPRLLQPEAQRGQRRGQPRRQRRQPKLELRRRGPTDDPDIVRAARAPAAAT